MLEQYKNYERFNEQYNDIYHFLLKVADNGYNEHFHWGRFEWMMNHSLLDVNNLDKIAIFRNKENEIVGLITYDTKYKDRTYILHSTSDEKLLINMLDYIIKNKEKSITIKVNSKDFSLCKILKEKSFVREYKDESVLQINLKRDFNYEIPNEYSISPPDFKSDNWKYQLVIHKGFNHEGVPPKKEKWFFDPTPNFNNSLKVFVLYGEDYCAHCGVWYTQGETAYIEPVVTIPQHRKRGLAKAVVYEAINRAKELGAKRAIVLSEQEFYFRIGFDLSSEFYVWKRQ